MLDKTMTLKSSLVIPNILLHLSMQNKETQQFAKFYIRDLKSKSYKFQNDKTKLTELNSSST